MISEGLVVTDTDTLGFKRIASADQIPRLARPSSPDEDLAKIDPAVALTRIFVLKEQRPSDLPELLRPFLSPVGSNVIPLDRNGMLIVTDVAKNVRRVEQLIEILDSGQARVEVEFVSAKNVAVEELASQLQSILEAKRSAIGLENTSDGRLEVRTETRTNSLVLIGTDLEISQAKDLLSQLDRDLEVSQKAFALRYFSPDRFDEVVRKLLEKRSLQPPYESRVEGESLLVESTPEVLELVERTRQQLDTREAPDAQSPIRFYKIKNVPAQELVETIRGVGGNVTASGNRPSVTPRRRTTNDLAVPGPNRGPVSAVQQPNVIQEPLPPPALREDGTTRLADLELPEIQQAIGEVAGFTPGFPAEHVESESEISNSVSEATITVDVHTNTIIVVAPPEIQRIYAKLIETLDKRRPQVLLEAKVIIVDTSDDYTLGVEISGGDRTGARRIFSFSSFGLSTVDPTSGALGILPGVGFNGTLVDPSTADAVVRAIASHRRARVLSTPRILVNDNAEGQLTSVLEVPFTSVNASQTVATTSFAGFAEAGTTITATPTISDDNYLQVDYIVTLNSFTGVGNDGVPPPRQTNEIQSRVTVPDGYTIIVGGLTTRNTSHEADGIPWLERIPIVRELSSLTNDSWQETSLFVFLKPVILREDCFKDLRYLSDIHLRDSGEQTNFPGQEPILVE
ncbi:hypothetical protein LOC72_22560 [Roseiconus lacunae]|nr:hypothetical protein [Roseiconus lacunae]